MLLIDPLSIRYATEKTQLDKVEKVVEALYEYVPRHRSGLSHFSVIDLAPTRSKLNDAFTQLHEQ